MGIRPSLKITFVLLFVLSGITTIAIMSLISINSFFTGVDMSMVGGMRSQAYKHQVLDGKPVQTDSFVVASRWRDLPQPIQDNLNEDELENGELLKHIQGIPFISTPKYGYFAIKLERDGVTRYVSKMFTPSTTPHLKKSSHSYFHFILFCALCAIIGFLLIPYYLLKRVATPIEEMVDWTKQLSSKDQLSKAIPDFHYHELNTLADIVQSSLQSVQESLAREQRFLGYASHELRTPIAVTRTNAELLDKMISKQISVDKQRPVLDRIQRAAITMSDLTDTLLWLNRQSESNVPITQISLGEMAAQLLNELDYLRASRTVQVTLTRDQQCLDLPAALCRIVITNLIRNALQHTQQGVVIVIQQGSKLIISNENQADEQAHKNALMAQELGFGLGLELTQRLVKQYGWYYQNIANDNGHYVEIDFVCRDDSTQ